MNTPLTDGPERSRLPRWAFQVLRSHSWCWSSVLLLAVTMSAALPRTADVAAIEPEAAVQADADSSGFGPFFETDQRPLQASATSTATLALPDLTGEWSITRSWYRRCPGCGSPVTLTTRWVIQQSGAEVRMEQGPRGALFRDGAGTARLDLEGLEQAGPSTLRFHYASLVVAADGSGFAGDFIGSERIANPCGVSPPVVTCFSSNGWIRATRLEGGGSTPIPSVSPTPAPTSTATSVTPAVTATSMPTVAPTVAASPTPRPSSTPSASPLSSQTPAPLSPGCCYLPWAGGG